MISIGDPQYFWLAFLLIPIFGIFTYALRRKEKIMSKIGNPVLVKRLISNFDPSKQKRKFYALFLVLLLGVLAAVNFRKPTPESNNTLHGIDIMIALDVSKSMLSTDIKPSRLAQAKKVIESLADDLGDNRLGLVEFAGQAQLQMPLTDDIGSINMYVHDANPSNIDLQGTEIGQALNICNKAFDNTQEKKYKSIVLITDGEDYDSKTDNAIRDLISAGVVVYTVGIGTKDGSQIIDPETHEIKKDQNGNIVISKLNEDVLKKIASETKGQYWRLDNEAGVANKIADAIGKMDKKMIQNGNHPGEVNFKIFAPFIILLMIAILVLEMLTPDAKKEVVA